MSGARAGRAASGTVSPPSKPKSVVAGLGKPGGKKANHPKSPSPPTRIPDVEMPDITAAVAVGEETEDSDTVMVRMPWKGKGKEPITTQLDGAISPPLGKESMKVVIGDKISPTFSSPPPPPPPPGDTESEDEPPKKEAVKPVPAPVKKTIGRIGKIGGKKAAKKEADDDAEMKDIVGKPELPSSSTSVRTLLLPTDRKHGTNWPNYLPGTNKVTTTRAASEGRNTRTRTRTRGGRR